MRRADRSAPTGRSPLAVVERAVNYTPRGEKSDVLGREGEAPCEPAGIGEGSDGASPSQNGSIPTTRGIDPAWGEMRRSGKGGRASVRAGGDRRRLGRSLALPKWLNPGHARYSSRFPVDRSARVGRSLRSLLGASPIGLDPSHPQLGDDESGVAGAAPAVPVLPPEVPRRCTGSPQWAGAPRPGRAGSKSGSDSRSVPKQLAWRIGRTGRW